MSSVAEQTSATFRAATRGDIAAIVALVESAYRGDVSRKGWTTEADLLEGQRTDPVSVGDLIDRPGSTILLAEQGGALLACANLERRGYRRTGIYSPFPYGDERFGIPRRDDLRFELLVKPL